MTLLIVVIQNFNQKLSESIKLMKSDINSNK